MPTKEKFYIEAIQRFCSSLDITIALRRLFDYLANIIPLRLITIGVLDFELKYFRQMAETTAEYSVYENVHRPLREKTIEFAKSWSMHKPTFINDFVVNTKDKPILEDIESALPELFGKNEISSLSLRLLIDGEWIGILSMFAAGTNHYTQKHANLLEPLQEPFAMVMLNIL